jgi:hypothetical protein
VSDLKTFSYYFFKPPGDGQPVLVPVSDSPDLTIGELKRMLGPMVSIPPWDMRFAAKALPESVGDHDELPAQTLLKYCPNMVISVLPRTGAERTVLVRPIGSGKAMTLTMKNESTIADLSNMDQMRPLLPFNTVAHLAPGSPAGPRSIASASTTPVVAKIGVQYPVVIQPRQDLAFAAGQPGKKPKRVPVDSSDDDVPAQPRKKSPMKRPVKKPSPSDSSSDDDVPVKPRKRSPMKKPAKKVVDISSSSDAESMHPEFRTLASGRCSVAFWGIPWAWRLCGSRRSRLRITRWLLQGTSLRQRR